MEKYSVLMTVYTKDNPDYFSLALDSMLKQTCKPDEIVLVKDGPIVEPLQKIIDDRVAAGAPIVQVQLPQNLGLGLALNEGLKVVKNELIARMDSDDISLPDRCEKQLAMFNENPELDIVGCPVKEFAGTPDNIVGERKVPLNHNEIYQYAKRRDPFNHPTVMFRKNKVLKYGPYGNYRKNQDTDLWVKLLSNGCKGANTPEYLLLFRFDEGTYAKRKNWTNTKNLLQIRYYAFKIGFGSLLDFLIVATAQLAIFVMPVALQHWIYKKFLRR